MLASPLVRSTQKALIRRVHVAYLGGTSRFDLGGRDECRAWEPIVAAARLNENAPGLDAWLLAMVAEGLSKRG
jgi:hypothetical protein